MSSRLLLCSKLSEGGQNYIFLARDVHNGHPYAIKACKSQLNKKYLSMLRREFQIMKENLSDLDCIIQPQGFTNQVACPQNPLAEVITYPEHFMVIEYAQYGSLHELTQFTKSLNEATAFSVFCQVM